MEGSTVIIEDASDYLESLYRVRDIGAHRIEPGHGDAIDDAGAAISAYIDHRLERERQILAAIAAGAVTVGDLVDVVYAGIPAGLRSAAVHQVAVQLGKLSGDAAVWFDDDRTEQARVRLR
jgi:glyoxylase-like metal-dependent hydrolase (beta-lactamase superfamily II)